MLLETDVGSRLTQENGWKINGMSCTISQKGKLEIVSDQYCLVVTFPIVDALRKCLSVGGLLILLQGWHY
jgi:hypothetical protein